MNLSNKKIIGLNRVPRALKLSRQGDPNCTDFVEGIADARDWLQRARHIHRETAPAPRNRRFNAKKRAEERERRVKRGLK